MASKIHIHRPVEELTRGPFDFMGCTEVKAGGVCTTPKAHDGMSYIHVCQCGFERQVNVCGIENVERGEWAKKAVA